jgi:hypothetical protein
VTTTTPNLDGRSSTSPTIKVRNKKNQHQQWMGKGGIGNFTFPANKEIIIDALLFRNLQRANSHYGPCDLVWDGEELKKLVQQFKSDCFAEFESLGFPEVKASIKNGDLSKGDKHEFALEWLLSKDETYKDTIKLANLNLVRWTKYIAIFTIIGVIVTILRHWDWW